MLQRKLIAEGSDHALVEMGRQFITAKLRRSLSINSSNEGEQYSESKIVGKMLKGIIVANTKIESIISLEFSELERTVFRIEKGHMIALEYKGPKGKRQNIAFREDISHTRLNLANSILSGRDAIYKDPSQVKGKTYRIGSLQSVGLSKSTKITGVCPSWYTEDWVTISFENGGWLVIRADRGTIKGFHNYENENVDVISIGNRKLTLDELNNNQLVYANAKKM